MIPLIVMQPLLRVMGAKRLRMRRTVIEGKKGKITRARKKYADRCKGK